MRRTQDRRRTVRSETEQFKTLSLVERLGQKFFESLEDRLHLSVTRDVNGFTVVRPAADSRVIYVSAAGSDSNDGLAISRPVKTVAFARSLLRNNSADQILLRRGDEFTQGFASWNLSGRSADEPIVIGAYTDPARPSTSRPMILTGIGTGFANVTASSTRTPISNVYIMGVGFEAHNRDYRQPNANFTINYREESAGGTNGLNIIGPVSNMLVEDCSFQYFRHGMTVQALGGWGNPSNIKIRRTVITDNYAKGFDATGKFITSEGIYAEGVLGLTLEENVFDHNGWTDPSYGDFGTFATIYNHNAYLNIGNENVVVSGNIFANGASHGIQMRAGGIATNNLFINNPIAMSFGYVNGSEKPGGVTGTISGNVIYGSNSINGQARGWGLEIGNTKPGGGTVIRNNIYTSFAAGGQPAIKLDYGVNNNNPAQGVGINDLTVQNNIVYGWTKGMYINPGFTPGGSGRQALNGLSVLNNEFQQVNEAPIVIHGPTFTPTAETWRGNRYDLIGAASASTAYWTVRGSGRTVDQWRLLAEPTASTSEITYPNAGVSPQAYNASIGGTSSLTAFLNEARQQSSLFWRPQYIPTAAVNYMRAGFSGQRIDDLPPAASLSVSNVTAGGGGTHSLTVNWTDDNQLNAASIGNGDLRITGPNGYSQLATLVSATPNADGSLVTAVYSIPAATGAWSATGNGTYEIFVEPSQVTDRAGNANPGGRLGSFSVNIVSSAPTAAMAAIPTVTLPTTSVSINVTYNVTSGAIDVATLGDDDLLVQSPNGATLSARFVSVSPPGNGASRVATYVIDAPTDGWTESMNDLYEVTVVSGSVASATGTTIGTSILGSFRVNVSVPRATASASDITVAGSAPQTITVTYRDNAGINASTVDSADLTIEGPFGFQSGVTLLTKTGAGTDANPLVATYRLNAPTLGGWDAVANNGKYFINLGDNQVQNTGGVVARGGPIGSFDVAIDIYAPAGVVTTPPIYKATSASTTPITVVYTDPNGVNINTVGTGDITVNVPGVGEVTPTLLSKTANGLSVTAVYSLPTPGGFDSSKNGNYDIYMVDGQLADNIGNSGSGGSVIGSLIVSIDSTPPSAYGNVGSYVDAQTPIDVTVYYDDFPGVDESTVGDGDIRYSGPGGDRPAVFVGSEVTDTGQLISYYQVAPPAGGWAADNNGTYQVYLAANTITDLSGNANSRVDIGTFAVNVATAPTATITPEVPIPGEPVDAAVIRFNQAVSGFGVEDLQLTLTGSTTNLLDGSSASLNTDDGITWRLSGLSTLTTAGGGYTLKLLASTAGIIGEFGLPLTQDASAAISVDATGPSVLATPASVTLANTSPATFTVNISDAVAVNANTLGDGDFIVKNDALGYSQVAKLVALDSFSSGPVRIATYSVPAPTGGWTPSWNGVYAILARASQIADTGGNFTPTGAFAGALTVNISGTTQTDTTPPTAAIGIVTTPRTTSVDTLTIQFTEKVFNLDLADITLTRNGGSNLLTSAQTLTSSDGINYTLNNLAGLTTTDGTYVLTVNAGSSPAVADASGNVMASAATRTWVVNTAAPAPTISSISPNPANTSSTAQNITINGANFTTTSVVRLRNLTTGAAFVTPTVVSRTSTQIVVSQILGTSAATWSAEVLNGAVSSGQASFSVVIAGTLGISVGPSPVIAKTATVSAVNPGSNTTTKFTWSVTAMPSGATTPTFSANNTNAAKVATITFSKAGTYTLKLTSTTGTTVKTATTTVTVNQTLSSVAVTPSATSVIQAKTAQFTAVGKDQFGANMVTQPTFTWSIDSGGAGGTVTSAGLYTAPANKVGSAVIRANYLGTSSTASITVTPIRINFQLASAPTVSGYLVDSGNTYAARNGQTYGWSSSHTDAAVDRNKNSTQLLDTNVGIKSGKAWDIALANGTYSVKLSVGDSSVKTTNTIKLESTTVLSGVALAVNAFRTVTTTITVSDGKLTLSAGTAANLATRVNYIEVTRV